MTTELARVRAERLAAAARMGRGAAQAVGALCATATLLTLGGRLGVTLMVGLGLLALMASVVALKNLVHGGTLLVLTGRARRELLAGFPTAIVRVRR